MPCRLWEQSEGQLGFGLCSGTARGQRMLLFHPGARRPRGSALSVFVFGIVFEGLITAAVSLSFPAASLTSWGNTPGGRAERLSTESTSIS